MAMGPMAAKLAQELRKAKRAKVVDLSVVREARAQGAALWQPMTEEETEGIPPNHAAWMGIFRVLGQLASALTHARALNKLAQRIAEAEEEYMPGEPPMSPVRDSVFICWWMADLASGARRETLLSMVADIGPILGLPRELCSHARTLAQSRMGVYRVRDLGGQRVQLEELVTGERVQAARPADMNLEGDLWLVRLLPPILPNDSDWVIWTTPYVLGAPDALAQWTAYCERVVRDVSHDQRAQRLANHFKAADDNRRWLEYIVNGYGGMLEQGRIVLLGVPDRPETLPHHPSHADADAAEGREEGAPLDRLRRRLWRIAKTHPFLAPDDAELRAILGAPPAPPDDERHKLLSFAWATFGLLDESGRSAMDLLRGEAETLPDDERQVLEALDAGWFSAFEVRHVKVDQGMEVFDLLRRRKLWIQERSATRQVQLGDVLMGWLLVEGERTTLEGAVGHVPYHLAEPFTAGIQQLRDRLARTHPKLGWKKRAGLVAQSVLALQDLVFAKAPLPVVKNHDGHDLVLSEAHYAVRDHDKARHALDEALESNGDGSYRRVKGEWLTAEIDLQAERLIARCNSRERLEDTKRFLQRTLGDAVRHLADSHADPVRQEQRSGDTGADAAPPHTALGDLPPEVQAQASEMLLDQMRRWVDTPIPSLGDKTPRQAVRSARGRDDVTLLLTRQEQIFASGNMPEVDLDEVWRELGLQRP